MKYATLREKISADKVARFDRNVAFDLAWIDACQAGNAAGAAHKPRAMVVCEANGEPIETVDAGVCGFAWVIIPHANKGFGHWLIKQGYARRAYTGGAQVWISAYNQSYERKAAHAYAMAESLRNAGIDAYSDSRLD
tara:strand:- start:1142 stop:1552 length:411 start_codon:yes stop_codon:yes gene_type:complete